MLLAGAASLRSRMLALDAMMMLAMKKAGYIMLVM